MSKLKLSTVISVGKSKRTTKPKTTKVSKPKGPAIFKKVKNPHPGSKRTIKPRVVKKEDKPLTKEQKAGIPAVINGDSFEGIKKIDHLPLNEQIDTVFNPLHSITKTTVTQAVSESTFIVEPDKK